MDLTVSTKLYRDSLRRIRRNQIFMVPISMAVFVLLWDLAVRFSGLPAFMLPSPARVWNRFLIAINDGSLLRHSLVTLSEVLAGLVLGALFASLLGYLIARSPAVERFLSPYIIASQAIPIVAIAPLLVIWLPGWPSKVLICALIVFFPILINTVVGLHSVPDDLKDLMRSLKANRLQTFRMLEVPASLPVFLGGLRIGATLSVIGAVVGEFVGSDRGLGFLVNIGRGQFDIALVFVAVMTLIAMALSLYGLVAGLEARLLRWRKRPNGN
jgi:NitT/TauT family transport system permease protein